MLWIVRKLTIANQRLLLAGFAPGGGSLAQSILSLVFDGGFARLLCICFVTQYPKRIPDRNILLGLGRCRGTVWAARSDQGDVGYDGCIVAVDTAGDGFDAFRSRGYHCVLFVGLVPDADRVRLHLLLRSSPMATGFRT